jgi:two-component system, LytTR family, response regulator
MREDKPASAIHALIVDDEPLARRNLAVLLRRDPEIVQINECESGAEAIAAIRESRPSLLFLDVQMPECDGFDVIELLGREVPPAIVFVTAHDEYALRAFDVGALDYLLKPFDDARFQRALTRAKEKLAHHAERQDPRAKRLMVKRAGQVLFLDVSDIDWVEAADYYASLHVGDRTYLLRRSLWELERDLDAYQFCRIHRSAIVNLDRVLRLELRGDGEYEVVLKSNSRLRLSRRFRKHLHDRLGVSGSSS